MQPCNIHGSIPMGGAMQKNRYLLAIAACASALVGLPAAAQTPEVTLTRLDCGTDAAPRDVARFSDTFAYKDLKLPFTFSCYLIKHGDEYMVWDTGFVPGSNPNAPKVSLVDQLAQLRLTPGQIKYVGISHYHADHTSQLPSLAKSTLLIGKGDWDAVNAPKPAPGVNAAAFANWISGDGKAEPVTLEGCVRRRHRRHAGHARAYTGPSQLAGQAEREGQCAAHR